MPLAEKLIWFRLRGRHLSRFKFRRHVGLGPFVLDFYCPSCKLAIEIDEFDDAKRRAIESYGITTMQFTKNEIFHGLDEVVHAIRRQIRIAFQQRALFQK